MRDLEQILFLTDFSEAAQTALPAAVALAQRHGAVLHLLHVTAPLPWPAHRVLSKTDMPGLADAIRRRCTADLEKLAAEIGDRARSEIHLADGTTTEEVERFVAAKAIDLIVVASRGHTGLKRFMLGSTTEKIVRTATCAVLVVRERPRSWDKLDKIIVPTEFSDLSKKAIARAVEIARPHGAHLVLAHVLDESDYPTGHMLKGHGILDIVEQTREAVRNYLEGIQAECVGSAVPSTIVVRDGVPSVTIADLAMEENADLVVIASHGRVGLARFILGRTAERVVRIAPCSVLILK